MSEKVTNMKVIEGDLEFYCFLKMTLPPGFSIVAEPRTSYYSEWQFCYKVRRGEEVVRVVEGDFRKIERGALVRMAGQVLAEAGVRTC